MFTSPSDPPKKVIRLNTANRQKKTFQQELSDFFVRLRSFELIPYFKAQLSNIRQGQNAISKNRLERINMILTFVLMLTVILAWRSAPTALASLDQLKNDLKEQAQVIKMEEQNNEFLLRLSDDRNGLLEKINTIYSAVPRYDEEAGNVISFLEDIGLKNQVLIDSISIHPLAENQFYYDELMGIVQPYQYSFSMETGLANIMGFVSSLRSSRRVMDIMNLDIEEKEENLFQANLTVNAYHLME